MFENLFDPCKTWNIKNVALYMKKNNITQGCKSTVYYYFMIPDALMDVSRAYCKILLFLLSQNHKMFSYNIFIFHDVTYIYCAVALNICSWSFSKWMN